jgi:RimJ/RimL family protein N-acetyltransferase
MSITLRRAELADRETIQRFHRALYLEHRSALMPEGLEILYAYRDFENVLREDVDAMLRNPGTTILVADEGERLLGYVSGVVEHDPRRVLSRKGILGDWFVEPDARGLGVGRRLVHGLFAHFRTLGCSVVETSTWPFNTGTRAAMGKLGFSEIQITYRQALTEDL